MEEHFGNALPDCLNELRLISLIIPLKCVFWSEHLTILSSFSLIISSRGDTSFLRGPGRVLRDLP